MLKRDTYRDEFPGFPEFLRAVAQAGIDGSDSADPRLEFAAATGLGEGSGGSGGFLMPTQFATDLWQATYDIGQILNQCNRQPITTGNNLKIPAISETSRAAGSRFGGVRTYWSDEADTVTTTKPEYRELTLAPKKLMGLSWVTDELLADVPALAVWLRRVFGLEVSFQVEDEIVNGNGVGRPLGILNSDALITVAKESGQAADTILPANFINLASRLWGASHRNAVWLTSNAVFNQIADAQFANGTPVVTYGPNGGRFILGMPLLLSEYTPMLGDKGDVLLADFGQYLIGEIAPDFISSLHVRFLWNESVFRFRWRIDGQPAWASAITPKNSNITQSPFVALAERA